VNLKYKHEIKKNNSALRENNVIRILLIEDNLNDSKLVTEVLENEKKVKFQVIHVRKFFNALNDLDETGFDLILLDLSLPDVQGLDTLRQTIIAVPDTPVIALTDHNGEEIGLQAVRAGAQDYLAKESNIRYLLVRSILYAIERKKFEEELTRNKLQYKSVFDNLSEGILQFTANNEIINANSAMINMLGYYSVEDLTGLNLADDIFQNSDDLINILGSYKKNEIIGNYPVSWKKKDGSFIQVQLHSLTNNNFKNFDYYEVIVENVTHQKNLEMEIQQSQKLDSIGNIAGGISHDLNNLLMAITMNLYLIEHKIPKDHPAQENLHETNAVVKQASELTGKILTFSRKKPLESKFYNLSTIISDFAKTLKRIIEANIEINFIYEHTLDSVKCDRTQIERVLLNLFVNARDAMPNGGILTLKTSNINFDKNHKYPNVRPGNYICVEISDTGTGIPPEAQEKIFEPYFTTKETGKGTGMGLSVVYGIIQNHKGFINFSSNKNGTAFFIFLPVVEVSRAEIDKSSREITGKADLKPVNNSLVNILLIEDNQNIQESIAKFLISKGFKVFSASEGLEALQIFQENKDEINLIFTDLVLPKKSGLEIYREIKAVNPQMRFLFTSGYSSPPQETIDFINDNQLNYIQKPYVPETLINKIHSIAKS
jgi:two-component system cell cycle sensor histidine kinase/response regulator CckA